MDIALKMRLSAEFKRIRLCRSVVTDLLQDMSEDLTAVRAAPAFVRSFRVELSRS